jgi:hypothetical protein
LVVAAGWGTPDAAVHVSGLPRPSDGTSGPFVGVRFIEPTVGPTLASLSFLLPTLLLFWTVFLPYLSALDRGVPPGHADLTTFAAWFLAVPVALALITKPLQIPDDFYVAPLLARLTLTASGLLSIAMSVVAGGATVWSANAVKRTHGDVRNVAPYILVAVGVLAIWSLLRLIDLATNPFDGGEKRALPVQLWKRLVGLWSTQT